MMDSSSVRLVGLDVGERRIGIAVSDELGLTAQARGVLQRSSLQADIESLVHTAKNEHAGGFVVGLPLRTSGCEGPEAEKVRAFATQLQQISGLPVYYMDERYSTTMAEAVLLSADISRKKRRQKVDQLAAALILQGYLDKQRSLMQRREQPLDERGGTNDGTRK